MINISLKAFQLRQFIFIPTYSYYCCSIGSCSTSSSPSQYHVYVWYSHSCVWTMFWVFIINNNIVNTKKKQNKMYYKKLRKVKSKSKKKTITQRCQRAPHWMEIKNYGCSGHNNHLLNSFNQIKSYDYSKYNVSLYNNESILISSKRQNNKKILFKQQNNNNCDLNNTQIYKSMLCEPAAGDFNQKTSENTSKFLK